MAQFLNKVITLVKIPRYDARTFAASSSLKVERFSRATFEELEAEESTKKDKKVTLSSTYKKLTHWKSKDALQRYLYKSIIYNNPDDKSCLIGLNKPYGLPNYPSEDSEFCLEDCLPGLAQKLEQDNLEILKTTERFTSGITLLAPSDKGAKQKLEKRVRNKIKSERLLSDSYLTLVVGHANINMFDDFGVVLKEFDSGDKPMFGSENKEPVIVSKTLSYHSRLKVNQKLRHIHISTIQKSNKIPLTLLSVSPSKTKNHLIRVYMAHRGYAVLGDNLYSYRTKQVLGKKVNWQNIALSQTNKSQILPASMLQLFGIDKGDIMRIPACVHLWRCLLPGWLGKNQDLTLFAPPPKYFDQTLDVSGIKFDFEDLTKNDQPVMFEVAGRIKTKKNGKKVNEEENKLDDDVIEAM